MTGRARPQETTRSEHWLRVLINRFPHKLDSSLHTAGNWMKPRSITWVSPLKNDQYAEYYDGAFLDRLGLQNLRWSLQAFWPRSGPRWDALGRTSLDEYLLVEAKAYPAESSSTNRATNPNSVAKIRRAFAETKQALSCSPESDWDTPYYQYANRLAHLYWLQEIAGVSAYLVCVYFVMAPDVPHPTTLEGWAQHIDLMHHHLGITGNVLNGRVMNVFVPVVDLEMSAPDPKADEQA